MKNILVRSTPYLIDYINESDQDIYDFDILQEHKIHGLIALTRIFCHTLGNKFPICMKDSEKLIFEIKNIKVRKSSLEANKWIDGEIFGLFYKDMTRSFILEDNSSFVIRKFPAGTKIKTILYPDTLDYQLK